MSKVKTQEPASRAKAAPKSKTKVEAKPKVKIKTTLTDVSVDSFIAKLDKPERRDDAAALVKLCTKVSGWPAKMWGSAIIGFGAYHYTYASGHSGTMCALGFSPRKANFAIYVAEFPGKEALLAQLGKYKGGHEQCLYINKLNDVDTKVLEKIFAGGLAEIKRRWPVTAA